MSTRNFIGSGQNSAHPLLDRDGQGVQQITLGSCVFNAHDLYTNEIYGRDERHAMILVSWIETFIFIRV